MSAKRSECAAAFDSEHGKLYVAGGYTDGCTCLATVEVLDVRDVTPRWTVLKQQMSTARRGCAAAFDSEHGKLYVVGGYTDGATCLASVEVLDTIPLALQKIRAQVLADEQEMAKPVEIETWDTLFGGDRQHSKFVGQAKLLVDLKKALRVHGNNAASGPRCALFEGPPGLGKTELAGLLAEVLTRRSLQSLEDADPKEFIMFNCAQFQEKQAGNAFFGALPGFEGGSGGLYNAIKACPSVIILFDEFEKMHPDVFQTLLAVLDTKGRVSSNQSSQETLSTTGATFIFSTNMCEHNEKFKPGQSIQQDMGDFFGKPIASRLTGAAFRFEPLQGSDFEDIMHRALVRLRANKMQEPLNITLRWTKETPAALVQMMSNTDGEDDNLRDILNRGMHERYFEIVHEGPNALPMQNGLEPVHTGGTITWYVDKGTKTTVNFVAEGMQQAVAMPANRTTTVGSTQKVPDRDDGGSGGGGSSSSCSKANSNKPAFAKRVATVSALEELKAQHAAAMAEANKAAEEQATADAKVAALDHQQHLDLVLKEKTAAEEQATADAKVAALDHQQQLDSVLKEKTAAEEQATADAKVAALDHQQQLDSALEENKATEAKAATDAKAAEMAALDYQQRIDSALEEKTAAKNELKVAKSKLESVKKAIKAGPRLVNHRKMLQQIMLCVGVLIACSVLSYAVPIAMGLLGVGAYTAKAIVATNVCKVLCVARVAQIAWKEGYMVPLWNSIKKNWNRLKIALDFVSAIAKMLYIAELIEWLLISGGWVGKILVFVLFFAVLFIASQLYSMVTDNLMLLFMWGYTEKVLADAEDDFKKCDAAVDGQGNASSDEATVATAEEGHRKNE